MIGRITARIAAYTRTTMGGDLAAGLTTAVLLIPQAMAYAMLAGLPPVVGLYASIVPLVLYASIGTSRQLAVGPVAIVSLLVADGLQHIAAAETHDYLVAAMVLALMVGAIQLAMGLLRMGFVTNFLSHPVVSGFTSAAAIVIASSQLGSLLGFQLETQSVFGRIGETLTRLHDLHPATLALSASTIAGLLLFKRLNTRVPGALVVVGLATLAVITLGLAQHGVRIVGPVPGGLPAPMIPPLSPELLRQLLPTALAISFVGAMESLSVARAFARRQRYEINANRELVGLGLANLGAGLFRGYPVTGGFSRTAVNAEAGAKTPIAAVFTAAFVALGLLLLTPVLQHVPRAALAAIIMTAVLKLVDIREMKHLLHSDRIDLGLLSLTFASTLLIGIEEGIVIGAGASMLVFVFRTTRPHMAVLGRLPGTTLWRNEKHFPDTQCPAGILAVRMDAQFYYGNISFLKQRLAVLEARREPGSLIALVLDASAMNGIDSSADAALREIVETYRERGIHVYIASARGPVRDHLARSGTAAILGEDHFTLTVEQSVQHALAHGSNPPRTPETEPPLPDRTPRNAPTNEAPRLPLSTPKTPANVQLEPRPLSTPHEP